MKIAMIIDGWYPVFGGGQVHVDQLCKGLIKNHNCEVDLFVRKLKDNDGEKYTKDEVLYEGKLNIFRVGITTKFFNIFGRFMSLVLIILYLLYKAKKEKYDIIHSHAYVSGIPAILVGRIYNIPVIYTVHGANNLDVKKKGILNKVEAFLLTGIKYDLQVSVSQSFLYYKNINKNVIVIPNGVDIERFNNILIDGKYSGYNFIRVGRFSWEKGLSYLIKGLSLINKNILIEKKFHLNMIGDGEGKSTIQAEVQQFGLDEFITFKGKLFGDNLIQEYKKNQVFILPSLTEGQPLTVLEAFASSLPVVATNVGDNKYFISKDNGFLFNSGNEDEIKNIIEKVLNLDISMLEKLGQSGYDGVSTNYTWKIMCEKVYNEYKKLTKNS